MDERRREIMGRWRERRIREQLRKAFGKAPGEPGFLWRSQEDVERYYQKKRETDPPEEAVDEVTWSDLSLKQLFDRINTTQSFAGEQHLYRELHRIPRDRQALLRRQAYTDFFEAEEEKRLDAQLCLQRLSKKKEYYGVTDYMELLPAQEIPFIKVCRLLQITLPLLLLAAVITRLPLLFSLVIWHLLLNLVVYALGKMRYEAFLDVLYGITGTVQTAHKLDPMLPADKERTEALSKLWPVAKGASAMLWKRQLGASGDIFGLMMDYGLGILMWDFVTYDKVMKGLKAHLTQYETLFSFVGEVDLCIALASFRASLPHWCRPVLDGEVLAMEEMYHPLLEHPVPNSFSMEENWILTGSNATGKSTFLKGVAVNVLLGQSMGICAAGSAWIPDLVVMTSMAVRDDILSGESYYMKEIRYLERMVRLVSSPGGRKVFCGIDEILKGTNTQERVAASIAILHFLKKQNCLAMVATHDIELARKMDGLYENKSFGEQLGERDVTFDYRLKSGINCSKNAIRLLAITGFPEEILTEAQKNLQNP